MSKICFYCVATHLGGAERSLLELVTKLETRSQGRYTPWLVLPKGDGPLVDSLRNAGLSFTVVPMPSLFFRISRAAPGMALLASLFSLPALLVYLLRVSRTIRSENPAAIHTTGIKCHALSIPLGFLTGVPVIWHLRDIFSAGFTRRLLRILTRLGRPHLIANSQATADSLWPRDASIAIVPNGLDPARYQVKRNRIYHEALALPEDVPMIGIIGVLARWKGQMEFLEMARILLAQHPRLGFAIIGGEIYDTVSDIGYSQKLKEESKELGIEKSVHFAGFASDPVKALNGLDILVHASNRPEPFGRVIIEAMACEIPLVASRAGGVLEVVQDGQTGLLFEPGSPAAMAACVERYLDDAAFRDQVKAQAHRRFLERFTIENYVGKTLECYEKWLSPTRAP